MDRTTSPHLEKRVLY
uniref:Uncharacterized protein n=1 Tax=Arundo donax TaxID=35708 RepID=A0A0A9AT24_ARUDO